MANQESRFSLDIHVTLKDSEGNARWKFINDYDGLDYGQVVATQATLAEAVQGLIGLGIIAAEDAGFKTAELLDQLKRMKG